MKNNTYKILVPTLLGSLAIGAGIGAYVFPNQVDKVVVNETVVEVPVDVVHNVTVEKMVDNGNLDMVLNHVFDTNGNVSYITSGLKDTEINQIVDRIVFVNDIKTMALNETESGIIKELSNIVVGNVTLNSYDIKRLRINNTLSEIPLKNINFDYKDATAVVSGQFEQNSTRYNFVSDVKFVDNKFDSIYSVSVN